MQFTVIYPRKTVDDTDLMQKYLNAVDQLFQPGVGVISMKQVVRNNIGRLLKPKAVMNVLQHLKSLPIVGKIDILMQGACIEYVVDQS